MGNELSLNLRRLFNKILTTLKTLQFYILSKPGVEPFLDCVLKTCASCTLFQETIIVFGGWDDDNNILSPV